MFMRVGLIQPDILKTKLLKLQHKSDIAGVILSVVSDTLNLPNYFLIPFDRLYEVITADYDVLTYFTFLYETQETNRCDHDSVGTCHVDLKFEHELV